MSDIQEFVQSILGSDIEEFDYEAGGYEWTGWRKYVEPPNRPGDDTAMNIVEPAWRHCHEKDVRLLVGPAVFKAGRGKYVDSCDASHPNQNPPVYTQIFALPTLPVLDIIELFKVGSHNDMKLSSDSMVKSLEMRGQEMSPEERQWRESPQGKAATAANRMRIEQTFDGQERWPKVRASLAAVMKAAPFAIQSADSAGLEATFLEPPKRPLAERIGRILLEVDSDLLDLLENEVEELGIEVPTEPKTPEIPDFEALMTEYIVTTGKFKLWWD